MLVCDAWTARRAEGAEVLSVQPATSPSELDAILDCYWVKTILDFSFLVEIKWCFFPQTPPQKKLSFLPGGQQQPRVFLG